jgi:2-keto-3-deoxy-L-rhamnonate aldolase RhmA
MAKRKMQNNDNPQSAIRNRKSEIEIVSILTVMLSIQTFRDRIAAGDCPLGITVTFNDPLVTSAIADSVDFIWLDLEHCVMSPEALQGHLQAAKAKGKPMLVRVAAGDVGIIKPVLDAGAEAIIVPMIFSADDARRVVQACRYPPLGRRGYHPRVATHFGRINGQDFVPASNRELMVNVQIETKEAVEALDEIVKIEGLDGLVIGPYDLSGSLGVFGHIDHPLVQNAIDTTIQKGRAAGKIVGIGGGSGPAFYKDLRRRGIHWVQVGNDYEFFIRAVDAMVRASFGEGENAGK